MQQETSYRYNFDEILSAFNIDENCRTVFRSGSGLINDTFSVKSISTDKPEYLLQRVNHHIFKDVSFCPVYKQLFTGLDTEQKTK